ncbi:hypothetical protein B0O99DRAFT_742173 [Bisporella sp. PMI_857]|nr:hypothetical protein B0O99DRAFT_742173 [Bisporella sp. PMI_857]
MPHYSIHLGQEFQTPKALGTAQVFQMPRAFKSLSTSRFSNPYTLAPHFKIVNIRSTGIELLALQLPQVIQIKSFIVQNHISAVNNTTVKFQNFGQYLKTNTSPDAIIIVKLIEKLIQFQVLLIQQILTAYDDYETLFKFFELKVFNSEIKHFYTDSDYCKVSIHILFTVECLYFQNIFPTTKTKTSPSGRSSSSFTGLSTSSRASMISTYSSASSRSSSLTSRLSTTSTSKTSSKSSSHLLTTLTIKTLSTSTQYAQAPRSHDHQLRYRRQPPGSPARSSLSRTRSSTKVPTTSTKATANSSSNSSPIPLYPSSTVVPTTTTKISSTTTVNIYSFCTSPLNDSHFDETNPANVSWNPQVTVVGVSYDFRNTGDRKFKPYSPSQQGKISIARQLGPREAGLVSTSPSARTLSTTLVYTGRTTTTDTKCDLTFCIATEDYSTSIAQLAKKSEIKSTSLMESTGSWTRPVSGCHVQYPRCL